MKLVWNKYQTDDPDIKWLVENQGRIVTAWKTQPMKKQRPIKISPTGKVRVEFCKTFNSAREAREFCEQKVLDHESAEIQSK